MAQKAREPSSFEEADTIPKHRCGLDRKLARQTGHARKDRVQTTGQTDTHHTLKGRGLSTWTPAWAVVGELIFM